MTTRAGFCLDVLPHLYGCQRALARMRDDLSEGRSVLAFVPSALSVDDVSLHAQSYLNCNGALIAVVSARSYGSDQSPTAVLAEALSLSWPSTTTPRTAASVVDLLSSRGDWPYAAILVEGVDQLNEGARRAWLGFLEAWVAASQAAAVAGARTTPLCIVAGLRIALADAPMADTKLGVHYLWDVVSAVGLQLACRMITEEDDAWTSLRWRENVLPELAGGDVCLFLHLWDSVLQDEERLIADLRDFAAHQGWSLQRIESLTQTWRSDRFAANRASLSGPWRLPALLGPWREGLVSWTPEQGWEINTAALARIGRDEVVRYRYWRGQVGLLLSTLERLRLEMCTRLTTTVGPDWPFRYASPPPDEEQQLRQSPVSCQWGYLAWLLNERSELRQSPDLRHLASQARDVRNSVAHGGAVTFAAYETLVRTMGELGFDADDDADTVSL